MLVDPLIVVFDDAEALDGATAALGVVARLLSADTPLLRVALATRRQPALRLARARAAGRLHELGPADLAFSTADCAQYLRLSGGAEPDESEVEAVLSATEGWPLGVVLAAGSHGRGRTAPSRRLVHSYFEEEVLANLEPELRRALMRAAIAPDLEIARAAGVGLHPEFGDAVDRRGLFVRGEGGVGRPEFHPLFREFLRSRGADEIQTAEQRAVAAGIAAALVSQGRGAESVDYYLAAEEWDAAATAVACEGATLVRTAPETVGSWLAAMPATHISRPELTLLAGQLAHGEGRFDDAVELCQVAVERFERNGASSPQRFAALLALGDALMASGDLAGAASLGHVLDDPDAGGDLAARAVGVFAAAALARQGSFAEGRALFTRALDDPCARAMAGLDTTFRAYYLELPAGHLDDALVDAREAVATLEMTDPTGRLPYALTYLMAVHDERGEDAEALAVAARTRARASEAGLSGWVGQAIAIRMASLYVRTGDVGSAEARLADVSRSWRAWGSWELEATRASIAAAKGKGHEARAAAERAARDVQERWPYFDRSRCMALLAPVLAGSGHPGRARELVEAALEARPAGFSSARLQAVLAWLRHDEGDEGGSTAALTAAWDEAGDQVRHVVRREWPRIARPIWEALVHGAIETDEAIAVLTAALPEGAALERFTEHPVAAVRRAVLLAAGAAGRPEGVERAPELMRDDDPGVRAAARAVADRMRRDPPPLAFKLLGGFELRRGTWLVDDARWERRVAQRLVRFLLSRDCGPVVEDDLIDAFWPDSSPTAARRSLQVAISAARAVLDPPGVADSRIVSGQRTYRLRLRDGDHVDAYEFERSALKAVASVGPARRSALQAATALWTGEPLPEERYSDWAAPWRERLIDRYAQLLSSLTETQLDGGDFAAAIDVARRLVEVAPLDETAHQRLIVAFARAGRRGHALRQYLACRHTLVMTLGVEPSEETTALQRQLLAGAPV